MKGTVVIFSLALLLAISGVACAATYQQRLPALEGYYSSYDVNTRSDSFDFGSSFTNIASVSLRIVGEASDSQDWMWMPDPMNPGGPPTLMIVYMPVQFTAGIPEANQGYYGTATPGSFFDVLVDVPGAWDSVRRDGFGSVQLYCFIPYANGPRGFATVEQAYLVVDGVMTSVPEPASLLALGSGLIALCGAIRRRK